MIDHECGHEIDRLIGLRIDIDFLKLYGDDNKYGKQYFIDTLSKYPNANTAYFIAEAWSEFLNNEKPRPIAAAVGMLIKKLYAEKHHSAGSSPPSR